VFLLKAGTAVANVCHTIQDNKQKHLSSRKTTCASLPNTIALTKMVQHHPQHTGKTQLMQPKTISV
jgi:hypothetical protein